MSLTIIGTVALDSVTTPKGVHDRILGGSATYAATAASMFTDVGIVSIVGQDFPEDHIHYLQSKGINLDGLVRSQGNTFHWEGYYEGDMSQAHTKQTDLNVLLEFNPIIPPSQQQAQTVFCGNFDPELQLNAIMQFDNPELVALDTMNYWIETKPEALKKTLSFVDLLIINDQEVRLLTGESNIIDALPLINAMGPRQIIVKKGEHGALMYSHNEFFLFPAYPLPDLVDPTGAGDSFAGGILGYLDRTKTFTDDDYRKAIIYGTLTSSFTVQGFSLDRLKNATPELLEDRYTDFHRYLTVPETISLS